MIHGKLIGIDHGLKRIGIAVSDELGITARELCVIRRKSKEEDFKRINQIATEEKAVAFVVGLPTNDAPEGIHTQEKTARLWVESFQKTTKLPVLFWDEQLTSHDARELARLKRRNPNQPVDDLAARLILQSYIDAVRDGLATPPPRKKNTT